MDFARLRDHERARRLVMLFALSVLLAVSGARAEETGGADLFAICTACHHERADATGPDLRNVIGRKAATVAGFRYSPAMKRANITWDVDRLRQFLRDPQTLVKGNRMVFAGFTEATQIEAVIEFIKAL